MIDKLKLSKKKIKIYPFLTVELFFKHFLKLFYKLLYLKSMFL